MAIHPMSNGLMAPTHPALNGAKAPTRPIPNYRAKTTTRPDTNPSTATDGVKAYTGPVGNSLRFQSFSVPTPEMTVSNSLANPLGLGSLVSPITLNLKGEEIPKEMQAFATLDGAEMVVSPVAARTLATTLELASLASPMTPHLKGEEIPEEMPAFATLEGAEMVVSPVPVRTLATTPMTLNLKGEEIPEEMPAFETLEGAEIVVSPVPVQTLATLLEVVSLVSLMTLNWNGEEMPSHATSLENSDSDAGAYSTSTHSLNPANPRPTR